MKNKTCFLLNYASHYRAPILKLINDKLDSDFYFGDRADTPIRKLDYTQLSNFEREFKRINLVGNFYWLNGSVFSLIGKYDTYVLTGEPYCLSNWFLLVYTRLFKKKAYLWGHGWYGRESKLTLFIKKCFYKLSHGSLLYGNYAKQLMIKEGFASTKLIPIYNSLNYDEHLKKRNSLKITDIYKNHFNNDNPTIIYVGRIQKTKRIDLILDAMNNLNRRGTEINFVLVGDKTDIDLSDVILSDDYLKSHVWLYGACYEEEKLAELFFNAAVCVSPGNVGLTAIHSMSFGTPVVTHNNFPYQGPEFEAIIDSRTGSFFDENNVEDLANKIEFFIKIDLEKREEIKKECFKIIDERYNPHYQLSVLNQLIKDKPVLK